MRLIILEDVCFIVFVVDDVAEVDAHVRLFELIFFFEGEAAFLLVVEGVSVVRVAVIRVLVFILLGPAAIFYDISSNQTWPFVLI